MTDITIPPAALEAGARAICLAQGYCWDCHPGFRDAWATEARAAFLAMIEAWEGMWDSTGKMMGHWYKPAIIIPLTENSDE